MAGTNAKGVMGAVRDETGLHASISGDFDKGPPIVLLHGFGTSGDAWKAVRAGLGARHATIAYDLPGHARSIRSESIGGAGRMAKAIIADLDGRGIGPVHLVGHSMGGAVASLIALRAGERVRSLTLLAPGGFGPEINHRLLDHYARASSEREIRLALENMFGWNNPVPGAMVDDLLELRGTPGQIDVLIEIAASMTDDTGEQGMLPRDGLAGLAMPVKVLWGTQDRVLPTRQAHKLPPLFAAHVFEDTGHMLIEEQEQAVVALIRQNARTGGAH